MEPETRLPSSISGLETFTLGGGGSEAGKDLDADSLFNLPAGGDEDEDEDEDESTVRRRR